MEAKVGAERLAGEDAAGERGLSVRWNQIQTKSGITAAETHLPKQSSRKNSWKQLNHDGYLVGTCNMASCIERYQMQMNAQAGAATCMALLGRLDEGSHTRFTMNQIWPKVKLDCRKSEVWNYLKLLDHVRSQISAPLSEVEADDSWQDREKNN